MKSRLPIACMFLAATACGSSSDNKSSSASNECASSILVGSWAGAIAGNADTMTFGADCKGTSSYCQSTFTYPNVTSASGSVLITNTATNGAQGCGPAGQFTCAYQVNGTVLSFSCGGGVVSYTKK